LRTLRQIGLAVTCITVMRATAARAQGTAVPPVTSGYDNGFFIQSPDGSHRLAFGLVAQVDGRFALDDSLALTNTFTTRKVRPTLSGRVAKYFDFKVTPDFGNGTPVLMDAYIDTRFSSALRVRVGKDKTPVGYELLIADATLFFPERALASSLVPNRDIGIQAQGDLAGAKVTYSGGFFNGIPDGTSSTAGEDANSDKEFAGRITVQPWRSSRPRASALSGFGFHLGGSIGTQTNGLPSFKTSVGQTYFSYAPGATANGQRTRVSPAAFYFYQSLAAFGEYMRSTQDVARAELTHDISNHAMEVTVAFYLTGEPAGIALPRPKRPFDPSQGQWGALQLLTRYSRLEVDSDVFADSLAAVGSSGRADQWTIAANWYPVQFIKWYVTYERTTFDHTVASRPTENVILFRVQLAF
jgi:phosphate-selective porin OprO/OprP